MKAEGGRVIDELRQSDEPELSRMELFNVSFGLIASYSRNTMRIKMDS